MNKFARVWMGIMVLFEVIVIIRLTALKQPPHVVVPLFADAAWPDDAKAIFQLMVSLLCVVRVGAVAALQVTPALRTIIVGVHVAEVPVWGQLWWRNVWLAGRAANVEAHVFLAGVVFNAALCWVTVKESARKIK